MLAYLSYLLQPPDVGCFSPIKRPYSCKIKALIRYNIKYITKLEFLLAFKAAFN